MNKNYDYLIDKIRLLESDNRLLCNKIGKQKKTIEVLEKENKNLKAELSNSALFIREISIFDILGE